MGASTVFNLKHLIYYKFFNFTERILKVREFNYESIFVINLKAGKI